MYFGHFASCINSKRDQINQGLLTVRFLVLDINEAVLKATATQREPAPNGMRPGDLAHTVH